MMGNDANKIDLKENEALIKSTNQKMKSKIINRNLEISVLKDMIEATNEQELEILNKIELNTENIEYTQELKTAIEEVRKSKHTTMNELFVKQADLKFLENTKTYIMGPVRQKLQQSILDLKLTDEVYFKDTTFVGNSVHKIFEDFRKGRYTLLDCFLEHPELYKKYLDVWLPLTEADTQLSKPGGRKNLKQREICAQACEQFCQVFPLKFKHNLTRKMHSLSLILPKHIRDKGLYYEFLCLEQGGEQAHKKLNQAEQRYSSIHNPEERYYLMLKSIKNLDKCDLSIFVPRK